MPPDTLTMGRNRVVVREPRREVVVRPVPTTVAVESFRTPSVTVPSDQQSHVTVVPVVGPRGERGASGAGYPHHQTGPSAQWNVPHNLGIPRDPVIMLDAPYGDPTRPVWTDVLHVDLNNSILLFPEPVTGWAYF